MGLFGKQSPPTTQTVTQTTTPSTMQQQAFGAAWPVAVQTLQNAQAYQGQRVAPPTGATQMGQNEMLYAMNAIKPTIQSADQWNRYLTSGAALNPESNPWLRSAANEAIRPLMDAYGQTVMPAIGDQAIDAGQYGSSRHGVAQGLATQGLYNAAGGIMSNMYSNAYGQGLDASVKGLALAPQTAGMAALPGQFASAVGTQQQEQAQAGLDAGRQAFYEKQLFPFQVAQDVSAFASGLPGATSSMTGPTGVQSPSPLMGALGGASAGAGIAAAIPGIGPWAVGIGAILGLLGS